jgi:hypothetical protein
VAHRPQDDPPEHSNKELHKLIDLWDARQLAAALAGEWLLEDTYDALLKQVRKYAAELEQLNPDAYNATHVLATIALALSCAETKQTQLDILKVEAQYLMRLRAEMRRRRTMRAKLVAGIETIAPFIESAMGALVWPMVALTIFILMSEGVL